MKKRMSRAITVLVIFVMLLGSFGTVTIRAADTGTDYDPSDSYRISGTLADGSYVVSAFNVKDYGAVGDGVNDDTEAIESAFTKMRTTCRGGILYFPTGTYRITKPGFSIGEGMTVLGETMPGKMDSGKESVILCDFDASVKSPVFIMETGATLSGLSFYYPKQKIDAPLAYPATIGVKGVGDYLTIRDVLLYNSYDGIDALGGGQHVANIGGTVLHTGLQIGSNAEVSEFMNIDFSATYWSERDGTDKNKIVAYTKKNATGLTVGYADELMIYRVSCPSTEFFRGIYFYVQSAMREVGNSGIAYGNIYKIQGTAVSYGDNYGYDAWWPDLKFLDEVPGTQAYTFDEPENRYSTKTTLYNVRAFGARGDGKTDDTLAFRAAIEEARVNGGGIVFMPAGNYLISGKLELPQNTELLGESVGYHDYSPSVIYVNYRGQGADDYLIGLSDGSGVQGVQFYLPFHDPKAYELPDAKDYSYANGKNYDVYSDEFPIDKLDLTEFPFLIRGKGESIWVENVGIANAWNGVDFASERCDNFVIRGLWGTCMNRGLTIGGGSENGRICGAWFTYGSWWKVINRSVELSHYSFYASKAYRFGDCRNIQVLSAGCFGLCRGFEFVAEGGKQPENISIFRAVADMPFGTVALRMTCGDRISVLGASTGLNSSPKIDRIATALTVTDGMKGTAYFYGQNQWGNAKNILQENTVLYTEDFHTAKTIDHAFPAMTYLTDFDIDPKPEYKAPEHPEGIASTQQVCFNHNAGAEFSYDEQSGVITASKGGALSAFLDSYDPETGSRKTDFDHKYIQYSYRFIEQYEEPTGNMDWLMYFTLRNPSGYLPMWANDYGAYVIVYRNRVEFAVYHGSQKVVSQSIATDPIAAMNYGKFEVIDADWHTITIEIDEEAQTVTVLRDAGTENEKKMVTSTKVRGENVLMSSGGYSFCFYHSDMQVGDFVFEATKPAEQPDVPDEPQPDVPDQPDAPDEPQPDEPDVPQQGDEGDGDTPAKAGTGWIVAIVAVAAVGAVGAAVLLVIRKKKMA